MSADGTTPCSRTSWFGESCPVSIGNSPSESSSEVSGLPDNRATEKYLMSIPPTQAIFPLIEAGELDAVRRLLDDDPGLVHVRHADPEVQHFTPLQFAAAKGQLAICRLLVERGAEVYTNPMNTYPPVMEA